MSPTARTRPSLPLPAALCVGLAACGGSASRSADLPPDVIVVLVDTLRADHLGCYGYWLDTSPEIDAFAANATLFEANTSQSNSTAPSILSMLTGVYPRTHANYFAVPLEGNFVDSSDLVNIAQRLEPLDYEARAIWSHPMWTVRGDENPLERGFDEYIVPPPNESYDVRNDWGDAALTTDRALESIDAADPTRPLFQLVHYFDPHTPYRPPESDRDRFLEDHLEREGLERHADLLRGLEHRRALSVAEIPAVDRERASMTLGLVRYDEEIRDMSREVGRLFDGLRERERFDSSVVILLADHGENMTAGTLEELKRAFTHGGLLEATIGTPLIVKLPGQDEGRRVRALSQNLDLVPTLTELLDLEWIEPLEGQSLMPLLTGAAQSVHDHVVSESSDRLAKALKTDDLKLIQETPESPARVLVWRESEHEVRSDDVPEGRVGELERLLDAFRPGVRYDLHFAPRADPAEIEVVIELTDAEVRTAIGEGWELSDDRHVATWRGTVGETAMKRGLELSRPLPQTRLTVTDDAPGWVGTDLYLGTTPLVESAALPSWERTEEPRLDAPLRLSLDASRARLQVASDEPLDVEVQATLSVVAYEAKLDVAERSGDWEPSSPPSRVRRTLALRAPEATDESLVIAGSTKHGPLWVTLTSGGRWIEPGRISLGGRAIDEDSLTVVWESPIDHAVRSTFQTALPRELPPGSITLTHTVSGVATDAAPSDLDDATYAELKALGYAE